MALQLFDRVKERVQAGAGTGNLTLSGSPTGFKTFSSRLSVSDTTYYCIEGPSGAFEIGIGTLSDATTLVRTSILRSSNADAAISIGSGQYFVFISYIADKAVYKDSSDRVVVGSAGIIFSDSTIQTTATDLSGHVPYTGANAAVNLGSQNLTTTGDITGTNIGPVITNSTFTRMMAWSGLSGGVAIAAASNTHGVYISGNAQRVGILANAGIILSASTPIGWKAGTGVPANGDTLESSFARSSAGVIDSRSDSGFRIRNAANSADAALTCAALGTTGPITVLSSTTPVLSLASSLVSSGSPVSFTMTSGPGLIMTTGSVITSGVNGGFAIVNSASSPTVPCFAFRNDTTTGMGTPSSGSGIITWTTSAVERARLSSAGLATNVLISATPTVAGMRGLELTSEDSTDETTGSFLIGKYHSESARSANITIRNSRGTKASPSAQLTTGEYLGRIYFEGHGGGGFRRAASIEVDTGGSWAVNFPGRLKFYTHPTTSNATTLIALTLDENQAATFSGSILPASHDTQVIGLLGSRFFDIQSRTFTVNGIAAITASGSSNTLDLRGAASGTRIRDNAGTADGVLTCGAITASGFVTPASGTPGIPSSAQQIGASSGYLIQNTGSNGYQIRNANGGNVLFTAYAGGTFDFGVAPSFFSGTATISVKATSSQRGIYIEPASGSIGLYVNQSGVSRSGAVGAISIDNAGAGTAIVSRNSSATTTFSVADTGVVSSNAFRDLTTGSGDHFLASINHSVNYQYFALNSNGLGLGVATGFRWYPTISILGTGQDTTLTRNAAGVLQIGTTASNALGSLLLTNLTASGIISATNMYSLSSGTILTVGNNAGSVVTQYSNTGVVHYGNAVFSNNLTLAVAQKRIIAAGTNQRAGNATLVGGTVTVANTTVTANTVVILTRKTIGGTPGFESYTVIAATSFTITSSNVLDTSEFSYELIEVV